MINESGSKSNFSQRVLLIAEKLIGDYRNYTLENRIFNASALITCIAAFGSLLLNIFSGYAVISHLIYIGFIGVFFLLYYFGRFKHVYKEFLYFIFALIAISCLWFLNAGMNGTVPLVFIVAILVFTALTKVRFHLLVLVITIFVIVLLIVSEQYIFYELIVDYADDSTRYLQLSFGLLLSVGVVFVYSHTLKKNFLRENIIIKMQEEELIKANTTKDKMFSIISHDLRNPFNSILGFSELMIDEEQELSSEEIKQFAALIHSAADNTYSLLINLLNWSRLNQGDISFSPQSVKLRNMVDECVELVKNVSRRKQISIYIRVEKDVEIYADMNMIQLIIRNLLANAIKFTEPKGEVTISAKAIPGKVLEISVADTGIGMSEDLVSNIFNPDYKNTIPGTQGEQGTGLGLILCKAFVEKHNGSIRVESKLGSGSNFYFTIPGS